MEALEFIKLIKIGHNKSLTGLNDQDFERLGLKGTYHYIDRLQIEDGIILMRGWAFKTGRDSKGSIINLVLQSGNKTYTFEATPEERWEATKAFSLHNANYKHSGF